ncbi:hypothetical protein [Paenibacillus silvisoli]|uniref:hypothetical protein n=1 Tax=Paenibacillus silvisoli TaxID=3110539 RepID=UPI0028045075|nr:hypothetical protein [Paenibacillus silvisoli]
MLIYIVCAVFLGFELKVAIGLWKRNHRRDAVVLACITAVIVCYFVPVIGEFLPTTESLNTWIYKPVSEYVRAVLNISSEDHYT